MIAPEPEVSEGIAERSLTVRKVEMQTWPAVVVAPPPVVLVVEIIDLSFLSLFLLVGGVA